MNDLFNVEGIVGMLDAKAYKHIEMVFSHVGAIVDRVVTLLNPCTLSTLPTYCDIPRRVFRRRRKALWRSSELSEFNSYVSTFRHEAELSSRQFHALEVGTEMFHLVDHLVIGIASISIIHLPSASIWGYSHCNLKNMYQITFQEKTVFRCNHVFLL